MAERYGARPSAFLCIADEWAAFQFDAAVYRFGVWADKRIARKLPVFDTAVKPLTKQQAAQEYPNPIATLARLGKVKRGKVPKSGVW